MSLPPNKLMHSPCHYKVCLESNETGAINFFIKNWTVHQYYPLQSSSLGKPNTTGDVAPTPGSSAGSLHVEVPSAGLSQPFGCCPQFQNDDLWGGIWVSKKGISHMDSDQVSMGLLKHWNTLLVKKIRSQRWQCDGEHCHDESSKCLQSLAKQAMNPFSELLKDHTIVLNNLNVQRQSDLTRALTLVTFLSVLDVQGLPEWGFSSTLSWPSTIALWHLKTCALDTACSPSARFNFW